MAPSPVRCILRRVRARDSFTLVRLRYAKLALAVPIVARVFLFPEMLIDNAVPVERRRATSLVVWLGVTGDCPRRDVFTGA